MSDRDDPGAESRGEEIPTHGIPVDEISVTLPRGREFRPVANLMLGGLALQRQLTIETLEDLQLALGAVLDRAGGAGEVTVAFREGGDAVEARIGPVDLARELAGSGGEELDLRRVLWALVDEVALEGDTVRLVKRTGAT